MVRTLGRASLHCLLQITKVVSLAAELSWSVGPVWSWLFGQSASGLDLTAPVAEAILFSNKMLGSPIFDHRFQVLLVLPNLAFGPLIFLLGLETCPSPVASSACFSTGPPMKPSGH